MVPYGAGNTRIEGRMLGVVCLLNRLWQIGDEIGNILPAHIHHQRASGRQRIQ